MEVDLFFELAQPPGLKGNTKPSATRVFDDLISIAKIADLLGVGALWLPEHHFLGDYSLSSAPDLLLAAIARETSSIRLGFAILPLPIHDPVRIAEKLATLDVLSGGRVLWGAGRGVTKTELDGFCVNPAETRNIFCERLEALQNILRTGFIERDGQQFELNPFPSKRLCDGWMAAVSPESFDLAAELKLNVLTGPFKPWPMIKADLKRYRAAHPAGLTSFTMVAHCDDDHQRARRTAGPGILWAYQRIIDVTRTMMVKQVAGYEHYRKLGWLTPMLEGFLSLNILEKLGLACVGNSDHLGKRLTALNEFGVDRVSLVLGGGDLKAAEVKRSLEIIMREAMPRTKTSSFALSQMEAAE